MAISPSALAIEAAASTVRPNVRVILLPFVKTYGAQRLAAPVRRAMRTIYIDEAPRQVKTARDLLSIAQVNYTFDKDLADPDELLERYFTLTGWSEAVAGAGAGPVTVVQRFHRRARITRNGIDYVFSDAGDWELARTVAAMRPDIAHVQGLIFPAKTWLLRRAVPSSTAIVVQNHSDGGPVGRAPWFRLVGRVCRGAVDAFLFAAAGHADAWRQAGFISPQQPTHQVMEASTPLRPIARAAAREETGMRGSPAVLWVGRLNANKDPLTVLDGFERSLARLPDATLTMIYNREELLPAVRRRVEGAPALRARVHLVGAVPRDRMAIYFSAADLYVAGSHHEGSGYALMEASACGAIPVVSDIPTFRLLTGAMSGALWPPGDAAAFSHALIEVAGRDLELERARLGDYFARALTWEAVGRRAFEIYREVLCRRRSIASS
jgi:glycosyltransferase involved in cell wall biosynthesis